MAQLWGQLGITAFILVAMVVLAFVTVRVLKPKLNPIHKNSRLTLIETLPVAQRRSILLVKVDERELVIGVSETGMELLLELATRCEDVPEKSDG
ncbi:MAG: FliO/MopB family protein [Deltaproteobacteria bacterium]|nr:FliO/MopB family protein [Deltaproteobacteria bacterium]